MHKKRSVTAQRQIHRLEEEWNTAEAPRRRESKPTTLESIHISHQITNGVSISRYIDIQVTKHWQSSSVTIERLLNRQQFRSKLLKFLEVQVKPWRRYFKVIELKKDTFVGVDIPTKFFLPSARHSWFHIPKSELNRFEFKLAQSFGLAFKGKLSSRPVIFLERQPHVEQIKTQPSSLASQFPSEGQVHTCPCISLPAETSTLETSQLPLQKGSISISSYPETEDERHSWARYLAQPNSNHLNLVRWVFKTSIHLLILLKQPLNQEDKLTREALVMWCDVQVPLARNIFKTIEWFNAFPSSAFYPGSVSCFPGFTCLEILTSLLLLLFKLVYPCSSLWIQIKIRNKRALQPVNLRAQLSPWMCHCGIFSHLL